MVSCVSNHFCDRWWSGAHQVAWSCRALPEDWLYNLDPFAPVQVKNNPYLGGNSVSCTHAVAPWEEETIHQGVQQLVTSAARLQRLLTITQGGLRNDLDTPLSSRRVIAPIPRRHISLETHLCTRASTLYRFVIPLQRCHRRMVGVWRRTAACAGRSFPRRVNRVWRNRRPARPRHAGAGRGC